MQADQKALHKLLATRIKSYEYVHRKKMSTPAIAQMLANTLYYKRFFPYYTFNVLGGIDEQGKFHFLTGHIRASCSLFRTLEMAIHSM
jgi:20S proteasome subunit beta 6